jgi:hypothetical protein
MIFVTVSTIRAGDGSLLEHRTQNGSTFGI